MKHLLLLAFLYFTTASNFKAQLADGTIAPDFTLTDINGTTHHLYDILDSGYNVVIDISAVWCGPCWNYHSSGALEQLYADYGPEGANQVRVLFIEGDGHSTLNQLNGVGAGTQGNWVAGTEYPIILTSATSGTNAVVGDYGITYFPTVYKICSCTKQVYEVGQSNYSSLVTQVINGCGAIENNDIAVRDFTGNTFDCYSSNTFEGYLSFANYGVTTAHNVSISCYDGATLLATETWSGTLAQCETDSVMFSFFTSTSNPSTDVRFVISGTDDNVVNNEKTYTFLNAHEVTGTQVTVSVVTDQYGEETAWILRSSDGTILGSADAGDYVGNSTYSETITLSDNDCFEFEITDVYGDGMCCSYGNGSYTITDVTSSTVLASGGAFTDREVHGLTTEEPRVQSVVESASVKLDVYPNPTSGALTVETGTVDNYTLVLRNVLGQEVYRHQETSAKIILNLPELQSGNYVLNVMNSSSVINHKIQIVD